MAQHSRRRLLRRLLLAFVVVQLVTGGVLATAASAPASTTTSPTNGTTAENNTTVYQENPDNVSESGDLPAVQSWLSGRMAERLQGSSVELSQRQYEQARTFLGEDYDRDLSRYVDVAGDTDTNRDDRAGSSFDDAQEDHRVVADTLQEYEETREDYARAKERGDTERARELARELDELASTLTARSASLTTTSRALENATGIEDPVGAATISEIAANTSRDATAVRDSTFVGTTLTLTSVSPEASLASPIVVEGHVAAENGSRLANRTVTITVANRTYRPTLSASGAFTLTHQPTDLAAAPQSVSIQYRPADRSPYLGSNASRSVTIRAIEPSLSIAADRATARYGDRVILSGTVTYDGQAVADVPLQVGIGDGPTRTVQSNASGAFRAAVQVPAALATGEHEVTVETREEAAPVDASAATTNISIAATATNLTLETDVREDGVHLSGTFTTASGEPVASQPLSVAVDGASVRTVRSTDAGHYAVSLPASEFDAGENHTVAVRYDEPASNLEPANATATVGLSGGPGQSGPVPGSPVSSVPGGLLGALALVALVVVSAGWYVRDTGGETEGVDGPSDAAGAATTSLTMPSFPSRAIRDALASEDAAGVVDSYERLRGALASELAVSDAPSKTYREFAADATAVVGEASAVGVLTETYERAKFGDAPIPEESVVAYREALETVLAAAEAERGGDAEIRPGAVGGDDIVVESD